MSSSNSLSPDILFPGIAILEARRPIYECQSITLPYFPHVAKQVFLVIGRNKTEESSKAVTLSESCKIHVSQQTLFQIFWYFLLWRKSSMEEIIQPGIGRVGNKKM